MIARLALVEGKVAFEPAYIDIHFRMGQQRPAYARLNPGLTVPTLVLRGRVLDQTRAIAEYALGHARPPPDAETRAWIDLHCAYPIEELTLGRRIARNPLARIALPQRLRVARRRLLRLADAHPDLAAIYQRRAETFAARIRTFDPAAAGWLYARRRAGRRNEPPARLSAAAAAAARPRTAHSASHRPAATR